VRRHHSGKVSPYDYLAVSDATVFKSAFPDSVAEVESAVEVSKPDMVIALYGRQVV
jgi:hypothetical protein